MTEENIVQNVRTRLSPADLAKLRLPIPVTVDDEHAQPVTGYLLRLPEEMGGGWVVRDEHWYVDLMSTSALRDEAIDRQRKAARRSEIRGWQAIDASYARWWNEAYRVALKAER